MKTRNRALPAFLGGVLLLAVSGCEQIPATLDEENQQIVATVPSDKDEVLWSTVYPGLYTHLIDPEAPFIVNRAIRSEPAIAALSGQPFFSTFLEKVNAVLDHPEFNNFQNTGSPSGFLCQNPAASEGDADSFDDGNLADEGFQPLSAAQEEFCILYEQADWLDEYQNGVEELEEPFSLRPGGSSGEWIATQALPGTDECYRIWAIVDTNYAEGTPANFERFNDLSLYLSILGDPETASVVGPACVSDGGGNDASEDEGSSHSRVDHTEDTAGFPQAVQPALAATGANRTALILGFTAGGLALLGGLGALLLAHRKRLRL